VIDLSVDLLLKKDLKYLVVLRLSFRSLLLQELLLSELITRLHHLVGFGIIFKKPAVCYM